MDFVTASTGLISPYWMGLPIRYIHFGTLKGVLKRGYYQEFVKTLKHGFIVCLLSVLYLFTAQKGIFFSRFILFLTIGIYFILTYIVREVWKCHIKKGVNNGNRRKLLIISSSGIANLVI